MSSPVVNAPRPVEKLSKIWLEGQLVEWDDARVHVLTHTLHYGLGAFEGIRAYQRRGGETAIFRLRDHLERLMDSCRLVQIAPRFSVDELERACVDVVRANGMTDAYLRPLVWVGDGAMGIYAPDNPIRASVIAWRWGAYLGADALERGIRVRISSWARHHLSVSLAKGKIIGQYTNSILAKRDAKAGGFDEALLLDVNGHVSEGSGENLFIVKKGRLITPPLSASILAGITRDTILNLAEEEGIPVAEEMITRDQIYLADEAFFTGTAAEVTPIREVDFRPIGAGARGPITERLQARYFDHVRGVEDAHPEWRTLVA
ncbi:MAG: branched-chain amino acid transaminase [Polyangiaceae bacterium]